MSVPLMSNRFSPLPNWVCQQIKLKTGLENLIAILLDPELFTHVVTHDQPFRSLNGKKKAAGNPDLQVRTFTVTLIQSRWMNILLLNFRHL